MIAGSRRWLPASAGLFVYGKAGGGWVGYNSLAITNLTTGTCGNFNNFGNCSNSTGGWLVGAGFEYAFTNN
jgi:outer membrane immunogenic protein